MENRDEVRHWYSSPWFIGALVFSVLLAASCFAERLGPMPAFGVVIPTEPDSNLVSCGTVTRMDSTKTDTTFGWIQNDEGIRAQPTFRFIKDKVEVGQKYEITYNPKHVVKAVKMVKKCTLSPARKA